ncbi:MAG: DEAD/DEAH box helicase family protein [Candidatus Coproplasma sp.]
MNDRDNNQDLLQGSDIVVTQSAFNPQKNHGELSAVVVGYDKNVSQMCSLVETLDRYDDFACLKIDASKYAKRDSSDTYGIEYMQDVHVNGSVIQPHQLRAATDMLKRLRGFGMLADVVGSGKTFEACIVLSELAVRGVVKSMLIIAPDQVYHTWKETLEKFFGLGIGSLCEVKKLSDRAEGLRFNQVGEWYSPNRPLLVRWNDFIEWSENEVENKLFDVIVVDEAHHLCDQSGRDANALKLLSHMMQCKKKAGKEYCLLLSATPHDGNLEHMFNLWYFINEKGGIPDDFGKNVSEEAKSEKYRQRKMKYKEHTCHGATTVMEFINRVKSKEVLSKYYSEFSAYVRKKNAKLCDKEGLTEEYNNLPAGERFTYVQGFLNEVCSEEVREAVNAAVANAYHEGVLRQIMIRQPKTFRPKKKTVINLYFYPVEELRDKVILSVGDVKMQYDCANPEGSRAVMLKDGTTLSVAELVKSKRFNSERYQTECNFNTALIKALGGCPERCGYSKYSQTYYHNQFFALTNFGDSYDVTDRLIPVNAAESSFKRKFLKTLEILRKHSGQRVLVFFDYSLKRDKYLKENYNYSYLSKDERVCLADKFALELGKLKEFSSRILYGYDLSVSDGSLEQRFEEKEDAILIVNDANLTEGANLQSCNVIINFQVTSDPLSMDQRIGRVFRIKQANDVTIYSLADMNALEGYVLAYFTRIGLMTSNSGDATIISGSNNEHMVTLRCRHCGAVKLMTQEDYATYKEQEGGVWCSNTDACRLEGGRTLMREMNVHDFQCSMCRTTFSRSRETEGYRCIYDDSVSMCTKGDKHDRDIYCRKICVMSHCSKFTQGELASCPALALYRKNANVGDGELMLACGSCKLKNVCPEKCRVGQYERAISSCINCTNRVGYGQVSHCQPHVLKFDEHWEADCPRCKAIGKKGRILPRIARTFDAFINGLWNYSHKGDDSFCATLEKESNKIAEIQRILAMDQSDGND